MITAPRRALCFPLGDSEPPRQTGWQGLGVLPWEPERKARRSQACFVCCLSESPTVMLSAGSFSSPYEHLSQPETKRMVEHYTAYLSDNTRLIANPGLKVSAGVGPHPGVPCPAGPGGPADCESWKWEAQPLDLCLSAGEPERQHVAGGSWSGMPLLMGEEALELDEQALSGLSCTRGVLGGGVSERPGTLSQACFSQEREEKSPYCLLRSL